MSGSRAIQVVTTTGERRRIRVSGLTGLRVRWLFRNFHILDFTALTPNQQQLVARVWYGEANLFSTSELIGTVEGFRPQLARSAAAAKASQPRPQVQQEQPSAVPPQKPSAPPLAVPHLVPRRGTGIFVLAGIIAAGAIYAGLESPLSPRPHAGVALSETEALRLLDREPAAIPSTPVTVSVVPVPVDPVPQPMLATSEAFPSPSVDGQTNEAAASAPDFHDAAPAEKSEVNSGVNSDVTPPAMAADISAEAAPDEAQPSVAQPSIAQPRREPQRRQAPAHSDPLEKPEVTLRVSVDSQGRPLAIGVVEGDAKLTTAAQSAVRHWQFQPCEDSDSCEHMLKFTDYGGASMLQSID